MVLFMCIFFYSSFVCMSACAHVYFKTTISKQNLKIILIAGVPSSQALLGFLITAPPSVCVPAVLGVLAVWIQTPKRKKFQLSLEVKYMIQHVNKQINKYDYLKKKKIIIR